MVNILTPETEAEINRLVSEIERKNGTEIVVVVVPDTIPEKTSKAFVVLSVVIFCLFTSMRRVQ